MARRKRRYTVRTGDTAATIAKQLGVDPQTLMRVNTGVSNLQPGLVLKIPPTPPKPGDAPGGGGLHWGKGVADTMTNLWEQYNPWGTQPQPPTTYNVQDIQSQYAWPERIFSTETVAQLAAWQRPAGTPRDKRELYSDYRYSTDRREQYERYQPSTIPSTDMRQQYSTTGLFADRGIKPGLLPATTTVPADGDAGVGTGAGNYITHAELQTIKSGYGTEGRANMAKLAALGRASPYGIVNYQAADGNIYKMKVRDRGGGDIRFTPISGATRRMMARPKSIGKKQARARWGRREVDDPGRGYKTPRKEYRPAPPPEETVPDTTPDADFEAWVNQVTEWYGEEIWEEAKKTYEPEAPSAPGFEQYDYTTWAKATYDRFNAMERSPTKYGFYDWYQKNQAVFGEASWDSAMDKTVGGDYRSDKAKAAYEAYLGYAPDWEVEEPEFAGAAHAPRYQAGYNFDYDTRGGYAPMTRRKARPGYLGLINWRI